MRKALLSLHRWAGLGIGVLMFVVAVAGALLVFEAEIDRLLNPHLLTVTPGARPELLRTLLANVYAAVPKAVVAGIALPQRPDQALLVWLEGGTVVSVDPYSGAVLGSRDPEKSLARFIYRAHTKLLAGRVGATVVGVVTAVTAPMALTGLVLWWPRRILAVKRSRSWRRVNFDLHNALGFYCAPLAVALTLTGVIMAFDDYTFPLALKLNSHAEPPPVHSVLVQGAPRLTPDDAVRIADAALPGAVTTWVNVPPPGKGFFEVAKRFPEDRRLKGRSRVMIDQYSGQVLQVRSSRQAELGTAIVNVTRTIHTGDVFGVPTQAVAFVVSMVLASQAVTGFLIWWKPGRLGARASPSRGPAHKEMVVQ